MSRARASPGNGFGSWSPAVPSGGAFLDPLRGDRGCRLVHEGPSPSAHGNRVNPGRRLLIERHSSTAWADHPVDLSERARQSVLRRGNECFYCGIGGRCGCPAGINGHNEAQDDGQRRRDRRTDEPRRSHFLRHDTEGALHRRSGAPLIGRAGRLPCRRQRPTVGPSGNSIGKGVDRLASVDRPDPMRDQPLTPCDAHWFWCPPRALKSGRDLAINKRAGIAVRKPHVNRRLVPPGVGVGDLGACRQPLRITRLDADTGRTERNGSVNTFHGVQDSAVRIAAGMVPSGKPPECERGDEGHEQEAHCNQRQPTTSCHPSILP